MIVIAKFKGAHGSKGYKNGKAYELIFMTEHPGCSIQDRGRVTPKDSGGSLVVYSSMRKFLDNWEVSK
jgi:hypothetical protein